MGKNMTTCCMQLTSTDDMKTSFGHRALQNRRVHQALMTVSQPRATLSFHIMMLAQTSKRSPKRTLPIIPSLYSKDHTDMTFIFLIILSFEGDLHTPSGIW